MAKKTIRKSSKKAPRAAHRVRQAGRKPPAMTKSLGTADVPREVSDAFLKILQMAVLQAAEDQMRQAAFRDKFAKKMPQILEPIPMGELSKMELGVFRSFGIPPTEDGLRTLYHKGVEEGFLKPVDISEE